MSERIYSPTEITDLYPEIAAAYQEAFAGEPWFEVSKCADALQRCPGGLSAIAVGSVCELCESCPTQIAYPSAELIERFEQIGADKQAAWYIETEQEQVALAGLAWLADASVVARQKYPDVPNMKDWLDTQFGSNEFVWLDEVFANKAVRQLGNLAQFEAMITGLASKLERPIVAYRTINPAMIYKPKSVFGEAAIFCAGENPVDGFEYSGVVPDRRDFVAIDLRQRMLASRPRM